MFSEKKRVLFVHDHINGYRLPDNLHRLQIVGRDGHHQYAVVVVVGRLNLGQVVADLPVVAHGQVGQENGYNMFPAGLARPSWPLAI